MSKYSVIINGEVLDYRFKKLQTGFHYAFYVGDIYVGQVFNMGKYWSAVAADGNSLCPINGFKNRLYACEILLKMRGLVD